MAADFFTALFLAAAFFAAAFRADGFLADVFLAVAFLADVFLAVALPERTAFAAARFWPLDLRAGAERVLFAEGDGAAAGDGAPSCWAPW